MNTLGFPVGLFLLLISAHCCNAMPEAPNAPASCCFKFFMEKIPKKQIISITKTHSGCQEKAFVVGTAKRGPICVGQHQIWAQEAFKQQQVIKD